MLGAALLSQGACPTGKGDDDGTATAVVTGTGTGTATADPTSTAPASEVAGECTNFASTFEGCQIGGPMPGVCPAEPKGWSGAGEPGDACSEGGECKGIVCRCLDPVQEWYVGVCACDACADYDVACAEANVADCKQIAPAP